MMKIAFRVILFSKWPPKKIDKISKDSKKHNSSYRTTYNLSIDGRRWWNQHTPLQLCCGGYNNNEVWLCLDANTEVPKRPPYQNSGHQSIPHFKILLDINVHWNRRPLTIWRFCWQPFWKWWPRKNDPECKFHHYQPIPHFKILFWLIFCRNRPNLYISAIMDTIRDTRLHNEYNWMCIKLAF
jgi:hypothetical protein